MGLELVIYGEVKSGQLRAKRPDLRAWRDGPVTITIKPKRKTRTPAQNRAWWGVALPVIAEHLGYDRDEYDELHYWLVEKCFGSHFDERIGADVPNVRSSHLDTEQFSELYAWAQRWAAKEYGVFIPDPE